ncbi:MAG: DEAD/DEAH box helicase family protein [Oscillospiraceae bacterium]|nr:DEAD/DEAH box helicase family protein [Oscillospiraceae bacterium]
MKLVPKGINPEKVITKAEDIILNVPTNLSAYCLVTNYVMGDDKNYLSSIFTTEDVDHLNTGESILASPTGSGKTKAIEKIVESIRKDKLVIILTNRISCKIQLVKDLCNIYGLKDIPPELSDKITLDENIKIMCYQEFVNNRYRYHEKKMLLILDECHFFAEDSTFSNCLQKILDFLLVNLDNTIRIYITATPDDIINTIWKLESLSNHKLTEVTPDTKEQDLLNAVGCTKTRIRCIYIMKANWDYLTFKSYDPHDTETLLAYIKTANKDDKKSLIYILMILKKVD